MSVQQQQRANTKSIGNYILGRTIGEGTFGKVKLGRHILSGANVAVKVLQKERIVEVADVERVAREVHILKLIRHPHIVQLFEIIETRGQLYLIMEYASGGELFDYIVAKGRVPEPEACRFFHQLIAGVEKIHEMHVVHRDLKPENLLLDEHNCVKIVDFGLSNLFRDGQRLSTACGSPCYAPPEMVAGQQYVPQMCDLWSCGVILFALVCGYLPFEDQNTAALYKKILAADYALPNFISDAVKDLISGLLTVDPTRRAKISDVRAHAWYRQVPEASVQPQERSAGSANLDEDVLHELEAYGFPRDYAVRCLELNKHNHITTTYWLLLERKRRVLEQLDMTGTGGVDGSLRATASSVGTTRPMEADVTPTNRAGAGDGATTPVVGGAAIYMDQQSTGGRTPRAGTVGPNASARESSHTPRCDTGRGSQQSRRVSATVPRPNTSPNRRDGTNYSARGRGTAGPCGGHEGIGSISVAAAATAATPRTSSPWRSNAQSATPYSARNRTAGSGNNNAFGPEGGDRAGVSGAVTPGIASPYRPGAIAGSQQSTTPNPYSARGKTGSGSSGGNVGALDSNTTASTTASTTPGASSPWRGQASAAPQIGSARAKGVNGGSGNSVDGGGAVAAAAAAVGAGGVASGASSPWRASGGAAGQQSTTPQATPRVCTTPRTTFTPRGQAVTTPRAATPQGTSAVYRHPAHSQPPQPSQPAQQPQSSTLPAGMAGRPVMSSRRRPPTATSVGVVPGTAPVRTVGTPTSRMIWR